MPTVFDNWSANQFGTIMQNYATKFGNLYDKVKTLNIASSNIFQNVSRLHI